MRRHNNSKGFTIVELIIVIAVISILSAILVPVISNLIKRSQVTKDTTLVRNLNLALRADTANGGKTHDTMYDALKAAEAFGYDVSKINASATDNMILWDSSNDVFCYMDVEDGTESIVYIPEFSEGVLLTAGDYRLWVISDTIHPLYSTYYTGDATTINTSKGFDAGEETDIETINYVNTGAAQTDVVIRTRGSVLNVTAPLDTIKHYGELISLNIIESAEHSYHEFGTVGYSSIKKGRLVLEQGSSIDTLLIVQTEGAFDDIVITLTANATMPEVSRERVTIPAGGVKVCIVERPAETNAYWLYAQGIYEQVKVVEADATSVDKDSEGAEDKPEVVQTIAWQIANVYDGREENQVITLDEDGNVPTAQISNVKDGGVNTIRHDMGIEYFAGGLGTEDNPYLVATAQQLRYVGSCNQAGTIWFAQFHFKMVADITVQPYLTTDAFGNHVYTACKYFDSGTTFDGNGHTIYYTNTDPEYDANVFTTVENHPTIKNLNVVMNGENITLCHFVKNAYLENITLSGVVRFTGSNQGLLVNRVYCESSTVKFYATNCVTSVTLVVDAESGAYDGVFVGQIGIGGTTCVPDVRFVNCANRGTVTGQKIAMYIANPNAARINLLIDNCANSGTIRAMNTSYYANLYYSTTSNCYHMYINDVDYAIQSTSPAPAPDADTITYNIGIMTQSAADATLAITENADHTFSITPAITAGVVKYAVYVGTYTTRYTEEGNTNGSGRCVLREDIAAADIAGGSTLKHLSFVDTQWVADHPAAVEGTLGGYTIYTLDGVQYYLVLDPYSPGVEGAGFGGKVRSAELISVVAYDSSDNVLCTAALIVE